MALFLATYAASAAGVPPNPTVYGMAVMLARSVTVLTLPRMWALGGHRRLVSMCFAAALVGWLEYDWAAAGGVALWRHTLLTAASDAIVAARCVLMLHAATLVVMVDSRQLWASARTVVGMWLVVEAVSWLLLAESLIPALATGNFAAMKPCLTFATTLPPAATSPAPTTSAAVAAASVPAAGGGGGRELVAPPQPPPPAAAAAAPDPAAAAAAPGDGLLHHPPTLPPRATGPLPEAMADALSHALASLRATAQRAAAAVRDAPALDLTPGGLNASMHAALGSLYSVVARAAVGAAAVVPFTCCAATGCPLPPPPPPPPLPLPPHTAATTVAWHPYAVALAGREQPMAGAAGGDGGAAGKGGEEGSLAGAVEERMAFLCASLAGHVTSRLPPPSASIVADPAAAALAISLPDACAFLRAPHGLVTAANTMAAVVGNGSTGSSSGRGTRGAAAASRLLPRPPSRAGVRSHALASVLMLAAAAAAAGTPAHPVAAAVAAGFVLSAGAARTVAGAPPTGVAGRGARGSMLSDADAATVGMADAATRSGVIPPLNVYDSLRHELVRTLQGVPGIGDLAVAEPDVPLAPEYAAPPPVGAAVESAAGSGWGLPRRHRRGAGEPSAAWNGGPPPTPAELHTVLDSVVAALTAKHARAVARASGSGGGGSGGNMPPPADDVDLSLLDALPPQVAADIADGGDDNGFQAVCPPHQELLQALELFGQYIERVAAADAEAAGDAAAAAVTIKQLLSTHGALGGRDADPTAAMLQTALRQWEALADAVGAPDVMSGMDAITLSQVEVYTPPATPAGAEGGAGGGKTPLFGGGLGGNVAPPLTGGPSAASGSTAGTGASGGRLSRRAGAAAGGEVRPPGNELHTTTATASPLLPLVNLLQALLAVLFGTGPAVHGEGATAAAAGGGNPMPTIVVTEILAASALLVGLVIAFGRPCCGGADGGGAGGAGAGAKAAITAGAGSGADHEAGAPEPTAAAAAAGGATAAAAAAAAGAPGAPRVPSRIRSSPGAASAPTIPRASPSPGGRLLSVVDANAAASRAAADALRKHHGGGVEGASNGGVPPATAAAVASAAAARQKSATASALAPAAAPPDDGAGSGDEGGGGGGGAANGRVGGGGKGGGKGGKKGKGGRKAGRSSSGGGSGILGLAAPPTATDAADDLLVELLTEDGGGGGGGGGGGAAPLHSAGSKGKHAGGRGRAKTGGSHGSPAVPASAAVEGVGGRGGAGKATATGGARPGGGGGGDSEAASTATDDGDGDDETRHAAALLRHNPKAMAMLNAVSNRAAAAAAVELAADGASSTTSGGSSGGGGGGGGRGRARRHRRRGRGGRGRRGGRQGVRRCRTQAQRHGQLRLHDGGLHRSGYATGGGARAHTRRRRATASPRTWHWCWC